jgi:hypothetical protein
MTLPLCGPLDPKLDMSKLCDVDIAILPQYRIAMKRPTINIGEY